MRRLIAFVTLASLGASACAVGPNYRAPRIPETAAAPFVSATPEASSDAPTPGAWWRLYNDPVLDGLIQQAFTANTDIRVAEANLSNARATLEGARVGLLPTTTLNSGATYGRPNASAARTASASSTGKALWIYDAGFDVSYEVDLFGKVRRTIEAARADAASTAAARDAVKITVAAETTRAYVDGCAYGAEVDVAKQSVKVLQDTYDITVARRNAGAASDFDTSRQAALLEQTKASIPTFEGQRQASLFELAALLGLTPSQVPEAAKACRAAPTIAAPLPVGDGAALLKRRPDVREAERHLAAETARIGVATAGLYPDVTLGGSITTVGTDHTNLASNTAISYGIGPLISWSFPNIFGARARIKEAKATTRGALASFDGTVLTALKETEQALSTYSGEIERNAALRRAQSDSETAYKLAKVRFNAGAQSELDLLTTEQTLVSVEQALAASNETLAADQIQVFKALGGGWGAP